MSTETVPTRAPRTNGAIRAVEFLIFNVRWLLIPFYLGLVVVLAYYGLSFFRELLTFIQGPTLKIDEVEVVALDLLDIVMVANLIKMIITGSYNSFVSKNHGYNNENVSSGELKIKIATSVIVLSMIHLLKLLIANSYTLTMDIKKELALFVVFLVAAIVLSVIEYLHHKSE